VAEQELAEQELEQNHLGIYEVIREYR